LVLALVIMAMFTIASAGVITYLRSNETSFSRDRDVNRAIDIAEAGLQNGIAIVSNYDADLSKPNGATIPSTSYNIDGGTGSFSAVKSIDPSDGVTNLWTITSQAKSPDGRVTRTVQQQIRAAENPQSPVYDYSLYVGGTASCVNLSGGFSAQGSIWVAGDLCLSGNGSINPPSNNHGTVYIGGNLNATNNTSVGTSSSNEFLSASVQHCYVQNKQQICTNSAASHLWAQTIGSNTQTNQKPQIDTLTANQIYNKANWVAGTSACTGTGPHPNFQVSGDVLASPTRTINLTTGAYSCVFSDTFGNAIGSISYVPGTRLLTISGTIFLAANLDLTANPGFTYQGLGTIYVDGVVTAKNAVCGYPTTPIPQGTCTGGPWDQHNNMLEIVAMNVNNCPPTASSAPSPCNSNNAGWSVTGSGEYDVIAFVVGKITAQGNGSLTDFKGPVITDAASVGGGGGLQYPSDPPPGSVGGPSYSWKLVPHSWRQCMSAGPVCQSS
jgi:hypothetical protein